MEMAGAIQTSKNYAGLRCKHRDICAIMTGVYSAFMTSVPAFAAGESQSIISGITQGTEQIWRILIGVVAPIAAAALALQVIKIIGGSKISSNQNCHCDCSCPDGPRHCQRSPRLVYAGIMEFWRLRSIGAWSTHLHS